MRRLCCLLVIMSAFGFYPAALAEDQTYLYEGKEISKTEAEAIDLVNQGNALLIQAKYQALMDLATRAEVMAPNLAIVQELYGTALSKVGKNDQAREHLSKALSLDDNLPAAWLSLGAVYTSLGNNEEALKCYHTYLKKFPDDRHAALAKSIVDLLEKQKPSSAAAAAPTASPNSADNYFARACGPDPCRWALDQMPITVFISPGKTCNGYRDNFSDIVKQACSAWSTASAGKVTFRYTESADDGKIRVLWIDSTAPLVNKGAAGECKITRNGDALTAAVIKLLTVDPVANSVTDAKMKTLALNQIGTALGIEMRSPSAHDAMYYSTTTDNQNTALSDRDAKTIQRLYTDQLKPSYSALNNEAIAAMNGGDLVKAVSIFTEAHKLYPTIDILTDNLAAALHSSGLKALSAARYEKGIQFFDQALAVKPGYQSAISDKGVCYLNLGVKAQNGGDSKTALAFYQKACPLFEECHNNALLARAVNGCIDMLKNQGKDSEVKSLQSKYSSVLSTK